MSEVVYEGWMVRYGRRRIGLPFIHKRYFILESRLLTYYKNKPKGYVLPIKTFNIDRYCKVEDQGWKSHQGHMLYVLSIDNTFYNQQITMASYIVDDALIWKDRIESVIDQHHELYASLSHQESRIREKSGVFQSDSSSSSSSSDLPSSSSSCRQFSLAEIIEATDNFHLKNVIGEGGEGKVYLAEVHLNSKTEKTLVAIKHLKRNSTEFANEILIITKIKHPNLVSLLGYCNESDEKILIYEYMENGSLSKYVNKDSTICLSWNQRLKICLGAAYGLQHLHKETQEFPKGIIHRDVKPANILLDRNWVAKVSDFGMFKPSSITQTKSTMITDHVKGTRGYLAPEHVFFNQITRKVDVYAFGMVVFEVLCRKNLWDRGDVSCYLEQDEDSGLWAKENVDIEIKDEISEQSLTVVTDTIRASLQYDPHKRPTMDEIVLNLEAAMKYKNQKQ